MNMSSNRPGKKIFLSVSIILVFMTVQFFSPINMQISPEPKMSTERLEILLGPDDQPGAQEMEGSRYGLRIVEEFKNLTYVDRENTTCLVNTFDHRAILSGDTHNSLVFQHDAQCTGGCGDHSDWYTYNFGLMTWDEAEEMANMYGAQFMGAPDFNHYGYNAPYEQLERWVGDKDASNAYTSTGGWSSVNTRPKSQQHYCILAYANGQTPGYQQFGNSAVVNGKLYFYHDYGTISERQCYTHCREHGARPLNPYLFGINTRAHMVENHPCHGSVQYNGAGTAADGSSNHNYRGFIGYHVSAQATHRGYFQSLPLYIKWPTIGAVRMTWYEYKPAGTDIVYNMTADGEHWVTMENHTNTIFQHQGSRLIWNATFTTDDEDKQPYISKVVIEIDRVKEPEPHLPSSKVWQGSSTPELTWNFTDPDSVDHQSDYLVEIFKDSQMQELVYNSSWQNSSLGEHVITQELEDGTYFWRARTTDMYHAKSNFSHPKRMKIDITKPVGNITIEEDVYSVNDQLVDITINAVDNGSGVYEMQIISDTGSPQAWEPYKLEKRIALSPTDGLKTVGIRFKDRAGIISDIFQDEVYLDYKGPGDISISSTTHPDPEWYYSSKDPVFSWEVPFEVTAVKGYAYMVDVGPTSEPYKDVTNPASATQTTTSPGEFKGLKDGTYYFHIAACDVYDQWSNTSHFQFNIDSTIPSVSSLLPEMDAWFRSENVETSVIFEDKNGFGLDLDTIQYSVKLNSSSSFSPWTDAGIEFEVLKKGLGNNPTQVKAVVSVELEEGINNQVHWRITDLAGNGPLESSERTILIDRTPVVFSSHFPKEGEYTNDLEVTCGVRISDYGSGVMGESIEYSISDSGDDENEFKEWFESGSRMQQEVILVSLDLEFEPGKDNYIKWRATDVVGNEIVTTDPYMVWVNSPPVAVLKSPRDGESYDADKNILFNAASSSDPDGDELGFYWVVKTKETKTEVFEAYTAVLNTSLKTAGDYIVYLYVDDGHQQNVSQKVNIRITGSGTPVSGPSETGEEPLESASSSSFIKDWWWLLVLIVGVLLIVLLLIIIAVRRRKEDEETPTPTKTAPGIGASGRPGYQQRPGQGPRPGPGGMPPQYPKGRPYAPYPGQKQGAYPQPRYNTGTPPPQPPSRAGKPAPGYGGPAYGSIQSSTLPASTAGPADRPALPPGAPPPSGPEEQPDTAPLPPESTAPSYELPTFSTDGGQQDLNLLSLPPAPEPPAETGTDLGETSSEPSPAPGTDSEAPGSPDLTVDSIFQGLVPPETPPETAGELAPSSPEAPPGSNELTLQCHNCGGQYTAVVESYPALVTCTSCGTQGQIQG